MDVDERTAGVFGLDEPLNLAHLVEGHDREVVALVCHHVETTYGELVDTTARLRGGLSGLGIGRGDRVAILCGNDRPFVAAYLAIVGIGAVAVPLNPASPAPELIDELAAVEPVAIFVGPSTRATLGPLERDRVPSIRSVIHADGPPHDSAGAPDGDGDVGLGDLLAADPAPIIDVEPDSLAVLMYTSGTAGPPKAAMLTHRNLLANVEQGLSTRDHVHAGDVIYGVLPLFHIFGLNVVLGIGLRVGATIVLVERFDPATAAESIRGHGVTVVPGAPPMWVDFADFDELPDDAFATVRLALSGAARLSPSVAARFHDRYGLDLREGYGLTEASPVVTSSIGVAVRPGSVGRLLVGMQVRVVDLDGDDVPVGDPGEIWVQGPNVFSGYWNDDAAAERVLVDGWLRTGDVGTIDADGYLYLVGRVKDLIIVSGFNVYPAEVEGVLRRHPAVQEAAVVGVPHPHHGEAVKAYVVLSAGADVDEDALIEHCLDHLARYKCPSKVLVVGALPRHATGKLIRRELDDSLLAD